jgi:hypothetical protein
MTATNATIPLDASSAQRLVCLLGMLGSAHDGEVANAGRMADRLIREHGLAWFAPQHRPGWDGWGNE